MKTIEKYFEHQEGNPLPIKSSTSRQICFEEVDSWQIVWHGHYLSFLEEARRDFQNKYSIGNEYFRENCIMIPIVRVNLYYLRPLRLDEKITIETSLHWSEAARFNFAYQIFNSNSLLTAKGYTIHLFTDQQRRLLLKFPKWLDSFRSDWSEGRLK